VPDRNSSEATALTLAHDPRCLRDLRERLAANRLTSPLFRTADYTRGVEAAFEEMHRRRLAGLSPDHFEVA